MLNKKNKKKAEQNIYAA